MLVWWPGGAKRLGDQRGPLQAAGLDHSRGRSPRRPDPARQPTAQQIGGYFSGHIADFTDRRVVPVRAHHPPTTTAKRFRAQAARTGTKRTEERRVGKAGVNSVRY